MKSFSLAIFAIMPLMIMFPLIMQLMGRIYLLNSSFQQRIEQTQVSDSNPK